MDVFSDFSILFSRESPRGVAVIFRASPWSGKGAKVGGWGETIRWLHLEDGIHESQMVQKPLMVIVHKEGCPVCARVKPLFAAHAGISNLSQYFSMVNLEPNEVPRTPEFEPDGAYVPRFLFFSPSGRIFRDINGKEPDHKFFYDDMSVLESNMRKVLKQYREEV